MGKQDEISYIQTVARVDGVDAEDFKHYLAQKPYSDPEAAGYLLDAAQILSMLPPRPARILDLGVGSGWTSEIFARSGYEVVGLDISPEMIEIARRKLSSDLRLTFETCDYEDDLPFSDFDAVTIYDALHHAEDEALVVRRAYEALRDGGTFLCVEPGRGHATTEESVEVVRKYGTTEKDMPFDHIRELLQQAGFREIRQFLRLRQLPLQDLAPAVGGYQQIQAFVGLCYETIDNGLASITVAAK